LDIDLRGRHIVLVCLILVLLTAGHASAETRNGTIGEIIPISGTAPAADMIYLFMTGPGVPPYGSRMDGSISPVVRENRIHLPRFLLKKTGGHMQADRTDFMRACPGAPHGVCRNSTRSQRCPSRNTLFKPRGFLHGRSQPGLFLHDQSLPGHR